MPHEPIILAGETLPSSSLLSDEEKQALRDNATLLSSTQEQQIIADAPTQQLSTEEELATLPGMQATIDAPTALLPSDIQQDQRRWDMVSTQVSPSGETEYVPNDLILGAIHPSPSQPAVEASSSSVQGDAGLTQHGTHHQPQVEHGTHHQPQVEHGTHHQPQVEHGAHHQPQVEHGAHHQPQVEHGAHHQPQVGHGTHQQPQALHGAHHQAHGVVQQSEQGCRPSCLTMAISTVVIVTVITTSLLLFVFHVLPEGGSGSTQPTVSIPSTVNPGEIITVQGNNFSPGLPIIIAIDTQQTAQTNDIVSLSQANIVGSLQSATRQLQQSISLTVKSDGTFTTTIQADSSWPIGSQHTIYVLRKDMSLLVKRQFTVKLTNPTLTLCGVSTSIASITLGPVAAGQNASISTPFKLCTQGSGPVVWSSSWDTKQAPWLLLAKSGNVQAPQAQPLQLSASAASLSAGNYTTVVTFSSLHSSLSITLKVTLIVQNQNTQACIKPNATNVSLASVVGQGTPAQQAVTISNCGESGNWSAVITTDDGTNWLSANPDHGTLQKNASQNITLNTTATNLVAGTYTGHVAFGSGPNGSQIDVTLVVTNTPQVKPCVAVNTGQLTFAANVGGGNPVAQGITLTNSCGTGSWSATTDQPWLSLSATNGNINANSSIRLNVQTLSTNLAVGTYTGHATFSPGTATVTVTLNVLAIPCISVLRSPLTITAMEGNTSASQPATVYISNGANCVSGNWTAQSDVSWITLNTSSGSLNAGASSAVSVSVNEAAVGTGHFSGHITFSPGSGSSVMTINLIIYHKLCISANPTSLSFSAAVGYSPSPAEQTFTITSCANFGTLSSTTSTNDGANWLSAQQGSGQTFSVIVRNPELGVGNYIGHVYITITGSDGGTATIQVDINYSVYPLIG
jgi:hypothetical protein